MYRLVYSLVYLNIKNYPSFNISGFPDQSSDFRQFCDEFLWKITRETVGIVPIYTRALMEKAIGEKKSTEILSFPAAQRSIPKSKK